ncbi:MAG: efflux RND transporter periplasmic adaptor subunit [Rhodospirillaceae bacterium]|nr:efflux RND transporter periplasmic adaptor subunit [Rhodospirillaceae bacterium]
MPQDTADSGSGPDRPRWLGYAQLAAILAAIVVALYFARAPDRVERGATAAATTGSDKPAVRVVRPSPKAYTFTARVTGTVTLERKTRVVSQVVGRVVWVSPDFTNGGTIRANEAFIRIDPAEFEIRVRAAEMSVRAAEASLQIQKALAREGAEKFAKTNPGAEIPERVRRVSPIASAEARLGRSQAALALARLQLARTTISLPYDSRVVRSDVEVGELVGPAEKVGRASVLGVVYRPGGLQVRAPVEPKDLKRFAPMVGRAARIATWSGTFDAEVVRVSSVVAARTRLASMFLNFAETTPPDTLPAPGTFAEITVTGPTRDKAFVLPEAAARDRDSVWVVRKGALTSLTPKSLGRTADGWIVEPFDAGEGVVVGVVAKAREGMQVTARAFRSPE